MPRGRNRIPAPRFVFSTLGPQAVAVWRSCIGMLSDATYDEELTLTTRFVLSDPVRQRQGGAQ
jgi:hypothetical protein